MTPAAKVEREWISPSEAAHRLSLGVARVRTLADNGTLLCQHTTLGRLISAASVAELKEKRDGAPG